MRTPKKLLRDVMEIPLNDKNDEFTQERLLQRVAKIPISKTSNGLSGMDIVDYGDGAAFFIRRALFRDMICLLSSGIKRKGANRRQSGACSVKESD